MRGTNRLVLLTARRSSAGRFSSLTPIYTACNNDGNDKRTTLYILPCHIYCTYEDDENYGSVERVAAWYTSAPSYNCIVNRCRFFLRAGTFPNRRLN